MKNVKSKASGKAVKKVFYYLKGYKILFLITLLLASLTVTLSLYIPKLVGEIIDCIVGKDNVDFEKITSLALTCVICILAAAISQWIMNVVNNKITYQVVRDIRRDAFEKIQKLPPAYFDSRPTGETLSRIISDVDQFAEGLLMGFTQFFTGVMSIGMTLGFMLTISKGITVVVVTLTPISMFVAVFIAKKMHSTFVLRAKTTAEQTGYIDEMISGQRIITAFGQQAKTEERFDEINSRLADCTLKAVFISSIVNPSTRFINGLVYTAVTIFGALSVIGISGGMGMFFTAVSVGQLTCLLSYANQYTKPFNEISSVVTELQNALACAERIFELIDASPQIPDKENAYSSVVPTGKVSLEKVYFSYTPEQKLIENFNLSVNPGQKIAIVGPTGCGKTTLINLLMRFYDVTDGSIKVNFSQGEKKNISADIRDITRHSLRTMYGMVLQETWIKRGTIRDNIVIGKPDATDEEVIRAAKSSHAHSFIKRLPDGYDTAIGEDGGNLSQGQKQLLCITRVMLCLPPMLILDEATSSIDTRTEQRIQAAFAELMEGRTSFIVAHRLSTIKGADKILVMNNGNVIEQGTHAELLAKDGFYAELYRKASMS